MQKGNALYSVNTFRRLDSFVADFSSYVCSFVSIHDLSTRRRFGFVSEIVNLVLHYRRVKTIERLL